MPEEAEHLRAGGAGGKVGGGEVDEEEEYLELLEYLKRVRLDEYAERLRAGVCVCVAVCCSMWQYVAVRCATH